MLGNVVLRSDPLRFHFSFFYLSQTIEENHSCSMIKTQISQINFLFRRCLRSVDKSPRIVFLFLRLFSTKNYLSRNPVRWQKFRNLLFFVPQFSLRNILVFFFKTPFSEKKSESFSVVFPTSIFSFSILPNMYIHAINNLPIACIF